MIVKCGKRKIEIDCDGDLIASNPDTLNSFFNFLLKEFGFNPNDGIELIY